MRWGIIIVAATVLACGSDDDGDGGSAASYTSDQLQAAVLTTDDLGSDWTTGSPASESDETAAGDVTNVCGGSANDPTDTAPRAEATFSKGMFGPYLYHSLASLSSTDANRFIDDFRELMDDCDGSSDEDGTVTVESLDVGKLGDETAAYHIEMRADSSDTSLALESDYVVFRDGGLIVAISVAGFGEVETDDTKTYAKLAATRVEVLLNGD